MRLTQSIYSLFLASSLFAAAAMAADAPTATAQTPATETSKLEKISDTPAGMRAEMKDCPMHHGKKECEHKDGEPCPNHKLEKLHGKMHDQCDHKHPG